jgi:dolichol-phosphate mannosyltransferase
VQLYGIDEWAKPMTIQTVVQAQTTRVAEVALVVPTFNEQGNVALLLQKLKQALSGAAWEIVFVDDDSNDGTVDILRGLCRDNPNVRMLHRIGRRGLSSAVIEGILSTTAPYIAVLDADLQHDEKIIPKMLAVLKKDDADIVVGSRYISGGSIGNWDTSRQRISRVATVLSKFVVKADLSDPMSGFFMLRRSVFEAAMRNLSGHGYKILLDIVASSPNAPRINEQPFVFGLRQHGESKLDALVTLEYLNLLLDKMFGRWVPARFILFTAIGGLGLLVHMAVLATLLHVGKLEFIYSQTGAAIVAMTFNFFLNNILTYRDKRISGLWPTVLGLLSFWGVCSIGAVSNVGIANALFQSHYSWWVSGVAGVLVGAVWNYALSSVFTWRKG